MLTKIQTFNFTVGIRSFSNVLLIEVVTCWGSANNLTAELFFPETSFLLTILCHLLSMYYSAVYFFKKSVNGCFSSLLILKNQPQFRITSFMAQTNLNSDHYLLFLFRDILKCHPWLMSNRLNQHYNSYIKYILWLTLSLILTDFVLKNVNRTKKNTLYDKLGAAFMKGWSCWNTLNLAPKFSLFLCYRSQGLMEVE